ncbi:HNH endonuclease signature motif containing protein [Novosphingobium colocasiae]
MCRLWLEQGDAHSRRSEEIFLELHHLIEHKAKGGNTVENLVTICNVHHDQVHAGRLLWDGQSWVRSG